MKKEFVFFKTSILFVLLFLVLEFLGIYWEVKTLIILGAVFLWFACAFFPDYWPYKNYEERRRVREIQLVSLPLAPKIISFILCFLQGEIFYWPRVNK